jgi:hypothetical protein
VALRPGYEHLSDSAFRLSDREEDWTLAALAQLEVLICVTMSRSDSWGFTSVDASGQQFSSCLQEAEDFSAGEHALQTAVRNNRKLIEVVSTHQQQRAR